MNANQIKDKLREKNSIWYKTILDEIIYTAMKEKYPLYAGGGAGLTNNQQKKKIMWIHP